MPPDPSPERADAPSTGAAESDAGAPADIQARLARQRTRLALERTGLAQERTLMGWVRTCFSIIGFGFTIFTFVIGQSSAAELAANPERPKILCLALTLGGTLFMALAVFQYRLAMRKLRAEGLEPSFSLATFTSVLVCAAGLLGSWVIFVG